MSASMSSEGSSKPKVPSSGSSVVLGVSGNQAMRVKSIQIKVKTRFKYEISYGKAWRTRNKALEMRFGTFYDGYDCVVRLLETLKERNPGTFINIEDYWLPEYPTVRVLHLDCSFLSACASKHSGTVAQCYVWMVRFSLASTRVRS